MRFSKEIAQKEVERMAKLGFGKQKWVEFCEHFFDKGFEVHFFKSKSTRSKYVHICKGRREIKVRFSNHKPNKRAELLADCDFYVGITHTGVRTTKDAILFVEQQFNEPTKK